MLHSVGLFVLLVICVVQGVRGQALCGKQDTREIINFDDVEVPIPAGTAPLGEPYHWFRFRHTRYDYIDLINCANPWNPELLNLSGSSPNVIYTLEDDDFTLRHYANNAFTMLSFKMLSFLASHMEVFVNTTKPNGQLQSSQRIVLPYRQLVTVVVNQPRIALLSVSCVVKGSADTCSHIFYDDFDVCY